MALEQHFCHTCRAAEVSVDLERRMAVPKVVERSVFQEVAIKHVSVITVVQACPLIELPSHAPSRCTVATMFQYDASGLCQFRCRDRRDGSARMQTIEVVDMAVVVVGVVDVTTPLHQLSVAANLIRCQAVEHLLPFAHFLAINAKHLGGTDGIGQDVADDGMREGRSLVDRSMFRRR